MDFCVIGVLRFDARGWRGSQGIGESARGLMSGGDPSVTGGDECWALLSEMFAAFCCCERGWRRGGVL